MVVVKRYILLILVALLLLLSEAVTLFASRMHASTAPIRVDRLEFYYKLDGEARFLDLKKQRQAAHRQEISFRIAAGLARQADSLAKTEAPLEIWRYHGGPHPAIFFSKAHLYNNTAKALLNVPVQTTVRVRIGMLAVQPDTLLTDFNYLERFARWQTLSRSTKIIPAVAPDEDILLPVMTFQLYDFLSAHPNHWPVELEVQVSSPLVETSHRSIRLIADHFVMPVVY